MINCKICENYKSKAIVGLSQHVKMKHSISLLEYYIQYEEFEIPLCECGDKCSNRKGLIFYKTCGKINCKKENNKKVRKEVGNRPEVKEKIRKKRLEFIKNNPKQTAWRLKQQSWPEKFFEKECIKNKLNERYEIVKEYSIYPYYVDFAFINIKVAVEIDGSQHLLNDRKERDIKKDKLLNEQGWRVFRIEAKLLYNDLSKNEVFEKFINFISNETIINSNSVGIISNKEKKLKLKEEKIQYSQKNLENKINKILLSDINFSKFGWVNEVAKILQISPQKVNVWMKRNMLEFYEEKCFKRNTTRQLVWPADFQSAEMGA